MALTPQEFIRRFLLHVLPRSFVRIRHYGLISSRHKHDRLKRCRQALAAPVLPTPTPQLKETLVEFWRRVAAVEILRCSVCRQGELHTVAHLQPYRPWARGPLVDKG